MRILAIADVHGQFFRFQAKELPEADMVLLAGDLTNMGVSHDPRWRDERESMGRWIDSLQTRMPQAPILAIAGNHDLRLDWTDFNAATFLTGDPKKPYGGTDAFVHRLVDEAPVRVIGESLTTCFDGPSLAERWREMTADPKEDADRWAERPRAEVVVSHGPPYTVLDEAHAEPGIAPRWIGSAGLLGYIKRMEPRLVVCGHVHERGGQSAYLGETLVVNTARRWCLIDLGARSATVEEWGPTPKSGRRW